MRKETEYAADNYAYFTNEYRLTEEMCAEAEVSRMDILFIIVFIILVLMCALMMPFVPSLIQDYFSEPSLGTIFTLSGGVGITFLPPLAIIVLLIKTFPKKVGVKRFKEQLMFVPSEKRMLSFYNRYVEIEGTFKERLSYQELRRTGETKNLYLMYFKGKKVLFVPKNGFRKGTLSDFKSFIRERKTWKTKVYSAGRCLIVLFYLAVFGYAIWESFMGTF